jgi:predicted glycosyltransferase
VVAVVEMEPFGEATEVVWMLALLFRLEPKPKLLKREVMTSTTMKRKSVGKNDITGVAVGGGQCQSEE